jgi:hypothetical protein
LQDWFDHLQNENCACVVSGLKKGLVIAFGLYYVTLLSIIAVPAVYLLIVADHSRTGDLDEAIVRPGA